MRSVDFPPQTLSEMRAYIELADACYLRGFRRETLFRCWHARCHAEGRAIPWCDFLRAVANGEFDFLLRDATGQSYS